MSEKNRDDKNRWRNVTIAFRMSPSKGGCHRQSVDVGTIPAEPAKD